MSSRLKLLVSLILVILAFFGLCPSPIIAGDEACPSGSICYAQRSYSTWACGACKSTGYCYTANSGATNNAECTDSSQCDAYYPYCRQICSATDPGSCILNANLLANCDQSPGKCQAVIELGTCTWSGSICSSTPMNTTYGCCGPGGSATPPPASPPPASPPPVTPSCSLDSISGSPSLTIGASDTYSVVATPANGTIDQIEFTVSQTNTVISPATLVQDATSPYTSIYTAEQIGTATIIAKCIMGGVIKDTKQLTVTVTAPQTTITGQAYDATATGCGSTATADLFTPQFTLNPADSTGTSLRSGNPSTFTVDSTPGTSFNLTIGGFTADWIYQPCSLGATTRNISFTAATGYIFNADPDPADRSWKAGATIQAQG